jgi:hypothetical protein
MAISKEIASQIAKLKPTKQDSQKSLLEGLLDHNIMTQYDPTDTLEPIRVSIPEDTTPIELLELQRKYAVLGWLVSIELSIIQHNRDFDSVSFTFNLR